MDIQNGPSASDAQKEGSGSGSGKGNSFTFGNKEKEKIKELAQTNSSMMVRETPQEESSEIDTNELTDMERNVPEEEPLGEIPSRPLSAAKEEQKIPILKDILKDNSNDHEPGSKDSIFQKLMEENESQQKLIQILKEVIAKKDQEIIEIKEMIQGQQHHAPQSKKKYPLKKDHVQQNKLRVMKNSMLQGGEIIEQLPDPNTKIPVPEPKKKRNADWSIGSVNSQNKKINEQEPSRKQVQREESMMLRVQKRLESDNIENSMGSSSNGGRVSNLSNKQKMKPPLPAVVQRSPQKRTPKKAESIDQEVRNSLVRTKLGKLEALKFKMGMQNKSLKTFTNHNDVMKDVYHEDRANIKGMRRENNVFQNQQILRIERDLDRTSRQLQSEIAYLQSEQPEVLTEDVLVEIDQLFEEAEEYFRNKQELMKQRIERNKQGYGKVQSKINTNLSGIASTRDRSAQLRIKQKQMQLENNYDHLHQHQHQQDEIQVLHQERDDLRQRVKQQQEADLRIDNDIGYMQPSARKMQMNERIEQQNDQMMLSGDIGGSYPKYTPNKYKPSSMMPKSIQKQKHGYLKYNQYDMESLRREEEIEKQLKLPDINSR